MGSEMCIRDSPNTILSRLSLFVRPQACALAVITSAEVLTMLQAVKVVIGLKSTDEVIFDGYTISLLAVDSAEHGHRLL